MLRDFDSPYPICFSKYFYLPNIPKYTKEVEGYKNLVPPYLIISSNIFRHEVVIPCARDIIEIQFRNYIYNI
jgi:hypothetical protein